MNNNSKIFNADEAINKYITKQRPLIISIVRFLRPITHIRFHFSERSTKWKTHYSHCFQSIVTTSNSNAISFSMDKLCCLFVAAVWWCHQMETFSALLAICAENSPVPGEFPTQRPMMRSFDVFFDRRPNKGLSKQWQGWWFEMQSSPLWRHSNAVPIDVTSWTMSHLPETGFYRNSMVSTERNKVGFLFPSPPMYLISHSNSFSKNKQWHTSYSISFMCAYRLVVLWPVLVKLSRMEARSLISPFRKFSVLQKYLLDSLNTIHIWYVQPQLSCIDTCQIWTWYSTNNQCYENGKIGKITEWRKLVLCAPPQVFVDQCHPIHFSLDALGLWC